MTSGKDSRTIVVLARNLKKQGHSIIPVVHQEIQHFDCLCSYSDIYNNFIWCRESRLVTIENILDTFRKSAEIQIQY